MKRGWSVLAWMADIEPSHRPWPSTTLPKPSTGKKALGAKELARSTGPRPERGLNEARRHTAAQGPITGGKVQSHPSLS
jgi:hypothetical protein